MGQKFYSRPSALSKHYPIIGKNSEALADADAVYIDSNGFLAVITTSSKVLGFAGAAQTMSSTNQTVAKVRPEYYPWLGVLMVYGADQACTQTDLDAYADMGTVTSGSQQLNLAAGNTGQFHCIGFDPENDGTTTDVVVEVAEPQQFAFAQA